MNASVPSPVPFRKISVTQPMGIAYANLAIRVKMGHHGQFGLEGVRIAFSNANLENGAKIVKTSVIAKMELIVTMKLENVFALQKNGLAQNVKSDVTK